jgi:hypothetical protein
MVEYSTIFGTYTTLKSNANIVTVNLRTEMNSFTIYIYHIFFIFFIIFFKINKSSDLLFDNEYQDSGIYNAELPEPDYANAQNSAVWELHLLRV